ncbi:glucan biosynthesis protein G [Ancylobacter sp. 6x-1]|uniref:Glucan biosynthesis protein G n=1 Tax=Ancylobacter crimeensis TaxID=2579147 RepID=A0ABT0DCK6_9HYPH|nr:glucan biosynthesis protein G [Ancylobacter crimeensis]MCK0197684.1 glucan biosynthesis protein G [Ancylobacter crimeensis]
MHRRDLLRGAALVPGLLMTGLPLASLFSGEARAQDNGGQSFDSGVVRSMARDLASKPYKKADQTLPAELQKLSYDDYRNIRFNTDRSLWRGQGLTYEVQFLHRGFIFGDRVDLFEVAEGKAQKIPYTQDLFSFDHGVPRPDPKLDLGFSGFRIHGPINRPDYLDEIIVFQGASYFRAVAKGQGYGTSARGLSIKTGASDGEEFPVFRDFWIERPRAGADSVVVHALLDSPSATAVHRFTIRPGETTITTVEMTVFPRNDVDQIGLASLTSMFLFGPNDRDDIDDFRPSVCDAQGLAMINGNGERLWRPLTNPHRLQISVFADTNMRGFGLMQRQRSFFDYQDLEARYERRPSVWVEPIGDWGEGAVHLVEIPTKEEVHDNIVAFWRPKEVLKKGGEYNYTYRIHWTWDTPDRDPIARFGSTRAGGTDDRRLFVLDLVGEKLKGISLDGVEAHVTTNAGAISDIVLQPNPDIEGLRLSFAFDIKGADIAELRAQVVRGEERLSETWIYRWTA